MTRRGKFGLGFAIVVGLLGGLPRAALPEECPEYDDSPHKSGCADVSVSPARVRPGQTLTVSVNLNCGAASVFCSYSQAEGIVVDGTPMTGSGGSAPMYHGTRIYPDAGFQVPISGNGGHSVTFKIRSDAPDRCVEVSGSGSVTGPWVSVGAGSSWSTPVHFAVDRSAQDGVSLGMRANTPRPDEVKAGEKIDYEVTATCDATADDLRIWVPLPSGTVLVPGTLSDDGEVRRNEIQWRFDGVREKTVTFTAQVREARFLRNIDVIVANGRARAKFGRRSASDSVRVETEVAKPTQVRGTVYDVKLDFPRRTFVEEGDPLPGAMVELRNDRDEVVDSDVADMGGRYEVEADDVGTFELRVSAPANRYTTAANVVERDAVTAVQKRTVEITELSAEPHTEDVWVPRGLLGHVAESLHGVNNLRFNFAGFVPHTFRMDTSGIEAELGFLLDGDEEFKPSTEAHAPNGWDALIRLSACLHAIGDRYVDIATAVDDIAKFVPVAILIQLMQTHKDNFAQKFAGLDGRLPRPTAKSRYVEAAKITTLAFVIGNVVPPLLDRMGVTGAAKAAILELCYKVVRFGMNVFVPGMNVGDVVFEVLLQTARVAIFEVGMTAGRVYMQAAVDAAYERFAQRRVAGTHNEALVALEAFDSRVATRSAELHRLTLDSIGRFSTWIRGVEGIAFKLQSGLGFVEQPSTARKVLRNTLKRIASLGETFKNKLFIPVFALGISSAGTTVVLVPIDIATEVSYTFEGFPPGAQPIDLIAVEDAARDLLASWKRKVDSFFTGKRERAGRGPPPATSIPEVQGLIARLGVLATEIRTGDADSYTEATAAAAPDFDRFFEFFVPLAEDCFVAPWDGDPSFGLFAIQGTEAIQSLGTALLAMDTWYVAPGRDTANAAAKAIADTSRELNEAGLAAEDAMAALAGVTSGPRLFVSSDPGSEDLAPSTDVAIRVVIRNGGRAPLSGGTAEFEPTAGGLTLLSPASQSFGTLAAGASTTLTWDVRTGAGAPAFVGFNVTAISPEALPAAADVSFLVE